MYGQPHHKYSAIVIADDGIICFSSSWLVYFLIALAIHNKINTEQVESSFKFRDTYS
jgi:hypothetical protein